MKTDGIGETSGAMDAANSVTDIRVLAAVVRRPASQRFGGACDAARSLTRYVAKLIDIDFAEMSDHDGSLPWEGHTYHFCRGYYIIPESLRRFFPPLRVRELNPLMFSTIPRLMRRGNYDLLHIHCLHPIWACAQMAWACKRIGRPYVLATHGLYENYYGRRTLSLGKLKAIAHVIGIRLPLLFLVRNSAGILASSPADLPILGKLGVSAERVTVVPSGAEYRYFERIADSELEFLRRKYRLPANLPLLLFVGHLKEHKGVDILIRTMVQLPGDWHLIVAGPHTRPEYAQKLMNMSVELGCTSRITFTGNVPNEELPGFYQLADIFVFPTQADTMPLVILEALASGKPIVSTTVGGIPFQVGKDAALLVKPGDVNELATAITRLLENEAMRRSLGDAGRRRAEKYFRWSRAAKLAVEAYYQAIERHKKYPKRR